MSSLRLRLEPRLFSRALLRARVLIGRRHGRPVCERLRASARMPRKSWGAIFWKRKRSNASDRTQQHRAAGLKASQLYYNGFYNGLFRVR